MAGNIKGITIEFDGNTTKLSKALSNIKEKSKGVDSALRNVNRLLKFNPKNTELLAQKQTILKDKIQATKDRLEAFKAAQKSMDAQGVDKTSKEYLEVRRNIIQCESQLKTFQAELKRTDSTAAKLGRALSDIENRSKTVDSALKNVNKALKLDPRNIELLAQKQTLLKEKIQLTKDKLEAFKAAQKSMDAQGVDKTSKEYLEVRRNIIQCESQLKNFNNELKRTEAASSVVGQLGSKFQATGQKIKEAGRKFQYISIGAGLAFGKAAMNTAEYEKALAKVSTISDESQVPIKKLGKEILKLSNTYGLSSTELSEATYQALSASIQTKDVAKFVETSAKLAKTGFLETNEAVDVLTTTINAYGYKAKDAGVISDKLIEIQNRGKVTVQELANNMGQVIPTAAALGVNFDNLGAAYIVMTKKGIDAANATTYTRAMLNELSNDGSKVSGVLREKTGKSFSELMQSGKSLGDVLNILYDATGRNGTEFKNLWGNVRAGSGALALVQGDANAFNEALGQIQGSTGNVNRALEKMKTAGASFKKIFNALKNIATIVTGALAEKLAPVISFVADKITGFANTLADLQGKHDGLLAAIGAVLPVLAAIAPVLIITGTLMEKFGTSLSTIARIAPGFSGALGKAFGFLKANPIIFVVAALAALALMISKTGMSAEQISDKVAGFVNSAVNMINGIVSKLPEIINSLIKGLITMLPALVRGAVTLYIGLVQALPKILPALIQGLIQLITMGIQTLPTMMPILINAAILLFMEIVKAIPAIAVALFQAMPQVLNAILVGLQPAIGIVSDVFTNVKNKISEIWNSIVETVSQIIENLKQSISDAWEEIKSATSAIWEGIKAIITGAWDMIVSIAKFYIETYKTIMTTAWNAIKAVTSAVWNGIKLVITTAWDLIKNGVTAVINGVKSIVENVWNGIKSVTSNVWNAIKSAITSPIKAAYNAVSNIIQRMRALFNFSWKLPHLKLPHVSISGGFSLKPLKVPHFSLKWYKEGGIFDKPTIAGIGEAGSEAVLPTHKLDKFLNDAVARVTAQRDTEIVSALGQILLAIQNMDAGMADKLKVYLNTGQLVSETAPMFDEALGKLAYRKARG